LTYGAETEETRGNMNQEGVRDGKEGGSEGVGKKGKGAMPVN